jgi:hypothetical protein
MTAEPEAYAGVGAQAKEAENERTCAGEDRKQESRDTEDNKSDAEGEADGVPEETEMRQHLWVFSAGGG